MGEKFLGMPVRKQPKNEGIFVKVTIDGSVGIYKVSRDLEQRLINTFRIIDIMETSANTTCEKAFKNYVVGLFKDEKIRIVDITISPDVRSVLEKHS